jgi:replicative DNA helicase
MKNYFRISPQESVFEDSQLYRLMAYGETLTKIFFDRRNQVIFNNLSHLQEQIGLVGMEQFISYLKEQRLLEDAGGENYINKIFCGLEPAQ